MKKVVTIHLAGKLFQIEEDAYLKLEDALCRMRLKDPIRCESLEAIFSENFQNRMELGQKVVTFQMVYEILRDQNLLNFANENSSSERIPYQQLTRNINDKVLGGVCSGMGDYWSIDPVLFRLLFVVLFFGFGVGLLMYIIMWVIIPKSK
jgi:phage shock protein C